MRFEILAEKNTDQKTFYYDNQANSLTDAEGNLFKYTEVPKHNFQPHKSFSKENPLKKSSLVTTLKIQLGLSCNYSCDYCSQKFVERAPETSKKDLDNFMSMLESLQFSPEHGLRVEFWGGEPLVYWKTLKPLTEAIKAKFAGWPVEPTFSMITNGSILTKEICDWLVLSGFNVAISHDGPGQAARGPDPFDDPEQKKIILDFYRVMKKYGRISFNAMLNSKNLSRKAVFDWFVKLTGDPSVPLGEGSFVDAYDEDGVASSLQTYEDHFSFRRMAFGEIYGTGGNIGFGGQLEKIDMFTKQVLSGFEAKYLGQKCGMDNENVLAVDLRGNVMTCQNVSHLEVSKNGESHHGGHITDMASVELKSSTHWSNRPDCNTCPVLQLCKGACMFLDGELWETTCENAYSDNVALFALAIERMTGYIPIEIKGEGLPLHRQDIFGTVHEHQEKPKKKAFPIKVVTEKVAVVNEIEVYGKAKIG